MNTLNWHTLTRENLPEESLALWVPGNLVKKKMQMSIKNCYFLLHVSQKR